MLPVLAAGSLAYYAISTKGNPPQEAHLNDAGVWVTTNETSGPLGTPAQFGLLNVPVSQFATNLSPLGASTGLDIIQNGNAVAGIDGQGSLIPIDPVTLRLNSSEAIHTGAADVTIGGNSVVGAVAVLDPVTGKLWASPFDATLPLQGLAAIDPTTAKPAAKVGAQSDVAVSSKGTVFAVSKARGLTQLTFKGVGWKSRVTSLPSAASGALTVTAVGEQPVTMSIPQGSDSPTLVLPGGKTVELTHQAPAGAAVLQQAGPDSPDVLVETGRALLAVSLSNGHVRHVADGSGLPIAPVDFGGCDFAAWQGPSAEEIRACGGDVQAKPLTSTTGQSITELVFRTNHDQLLLNDRSSGQAWDDNTGTPQQIADWQAVQKPQASSLNAVSADGDDKSKGATANPDTLGARPGRVTTLHVLDNDKTIAGTVLTVNGVYGLTSSQASVTVAPDHQSVLISLSDSASGSVTFQYDDTNGAAKPSNKALVTVPIVPIGTNAAPVLRSGFTEPGWSVPANGVVTIPVLGDWRNYANGDPPALAALTPQSVHLPGASAIATTNGDIVYTAGKDPGTDTIKYSVVDGDKASPATLSITVQGATAKATPPIAHDDFVQATVGRAARFFPLANDLPGSDPLTSNATLGIAGVIKGTAGLIVDPPAPDGSVTVTPTAPGHYKLVYQDSYGAVNSRPAMIRVDAGPADPHAKVLAAPDSVTVLGQSATILDPISNDSSPLGNLLTVVGVNVSALSNLQVAVVHGRFLRVGERQSRTVPTTETFTYTVTDGATTTSAQVTVTELPALPNDTPVAEADHADVRRGDSVLIPVLDNDVDPGGDALGLVQNVHGAPSPGQLVVTGSGVPGQQIGAAFVAGDEVRYIAPSADKTITQNQQVTVSYVVKNGIGQSDTGSIAITIHPVGTVKTDQAPQPRDLEARVVAGGTIVIPVPTSGVDPDGDTVQVQGLALPTKGDPQPVFGALIGTTANSLTYQAYPTATNSGTDTFTYQVTDTYGLSARATVRVAVVQPTVLPAPVAHDIPLTAAPGSQLAVNVVTPRNIDYADGAPPTLQDPTANEPDHKSIASLDATHPGWLNLRIPKNATGNLVSIPYSVVADLGAPSGATITVQLVPGYHPPPIAIDQFAKPKAGTNVATVNLIAGDYSPVGRSFSVKPQAGVTGNTLTVKLQSVPQVIPFEIVDEDGASASAVAYIPANGAGSRPYWNGKVISIPAGKATPVSMPAYVVDPSGARLSLTTRGTVWSSPSLGLSARITGVTTLQLTGGTGYEGPAAVTFEVTRTGALNDFTVITVPVLVGHPTPVLRCPTDVIEVQQGLVDGSGISPVTQCHVYAPPSVDTSKLHFHVAWQKDPGHVSFKQNDANRVILFAAHDAKPGSTGVLTVSLNGYSSKASALNVRIVPAPPITVKPIDVQGILTTGAPTVINLASYVNSPFGFSNVSIVSFGTLPDVTIRKNAKGSLTLSATKKQLSGVRQLPYIVTDLTNLSDHSRQKPGVITLQFIGVPDIPTAVTPRPGFASQSVPLSWVAPNPNGGHIDDYMVSYSAPGAPSGTRDCGPSVRCNIVRLLNGKNYSFSVKAHNIAGWGDPSAFVGTGTPDDHPLPVVNFAAIDPQDGSVTLTWTPGVGTASLVDFKYTITWSGGVSSSTVITDVNARTYTVKGLLNDSPETFTITPSNRAGPGASSTVKGQSAGKPAAPTFTGTFTPTKTAAGDAAVTVSWNAVADVNGPGPLTYTLTRTNDDKSNPVAVCTKVLETSCTDTGLKTGGQFYRYTVLASNAVFSGPPSDPARVESSVPPETMDAPAVDAPVEATPDGTVTLHFTTVKSNGATLAVNCSYTTNGSAPGAGSAPCPTSPWSGYGAAGGSSDTKTLSGLGNVVGVRFVTWEDNGSSQNTTYRFGPAVNASSTVVTNGPPNPPTGGSCSLSGATVIFSWTAPSRLNGRAVTYAYSAPEFSGTTSSTSASHTYPEDLNSHTLTVHSQDSQSEVSTSISITCPDKQPPPPGAPGNAGCGRNGNTVTFQWSAPASNGLPYTYSYANADFSGTTTGLSASHDYPADGQSHTLTVTANDSRGPGGSVNITCPDAPVPPPAGNVSVSWGAVASTTLCGGDTSCRYWTVSWSNFGPGSHSVTAVFNGGPYCGTGCNTRSVSGSSGSLTYWAAGYCRSHYSVSSTLDTTGSNTIYTNDAAHPC